MVYVMKSILIFLSAHLLCTQLPAMQQAEKKCLITIFKCTWPNCSSCFSNNILLHAHTKAHKECEGKIYQCESDTCKQYFYKNEHLQSHYRDYHPAELLAFAKKIKKTDKTKKKAQKKKRKRIVETLIAASLPQSRTNPDPITLMPQPIFKVPFYPATQILLTCLERRRPMQEPGQTAILHKVPFKIQKNEMVKTTGVKVTHLMECPIEGCEERFATTHGRLHHLIYIHNHQLYTLPFKN